MSDPLKDPGLTAPKRATTTVKCEKHGLHYDSATMSGCVLCRKEAGGGTVERPAAPVPSGSLGRAFAVTALLLVLTTTALYFVHGLVIEAVQAGKSRGPASTRTLDQDFDRQMKEMGLPTDSPGASGPGGEEDD
jgi:hypothetical protein